MGILRGSVETSLMCWASWVLFISPGNFLSWSSGKWHPQSRERDGRMAGRCRKVGICELTDDWVYVDLG